jgi:hypothetical protein
MHTLEREKKGTCLYNPKRPVLILHRDERADQLGTKRAHAANPVPTSEHLYFRSKAGIQLSTVYGTGYINGGKQMYCI